MPSKAVTPPFQPVVTTLYETLMLEQPLLWTPALAPPSGGGTERAL